MSQEPAAPRITEVRPQLVKSVEKFNERAKTDEKFQETLKDMERKILLDVTGDATYHFHLKNYHIDGVKDGPIASPEVTVTVDKDTLLAIFNGETSAMRAYMSRKLKFQATLMDLLVLKKLF